MSELRLRLAEPCYLGREEEYVLDALRTKTLTMNRYVKRLEAQLAETARASYGLAFSSGTAALHIALLSLGLKPGQRVIVPACSYIATANAVRYCGAEPVFVDVHSSSWTIERIYTEQAAIRSGAVGIIAVNLFGARSDIPRVEGVWVLEDSCEATGLDLRGRAAVFSFHGSKIVTCGEGGGMVTDREDIAEWAALLRGQGTTGVRRYWHEELGFNYRLTDLQAALAVAQMEKLDEHLRQRRLLMEVYDERIPAQFRQNRRRDASVPWVMPVAVPNRDKVARRLADAGIETRPIFPALHTQPQYRTMQYLPVAERLSAQGLLLPLHCGMTVADVQRVCEALEQEAA